MIRRPPRSTLSSSSAASDVYKRQVLYVVYFTQYPFYAHQRWSSRGHGLSLEDPRGQLTMSFVLGFKSVVLALDCQSLALASGYQSLALTSDCQSLASNYQALALEVVLDIGGEHSNFLVINPSSPTLKLKLKADFYSAIKSGDSEALSFSQASRST